MELLKETFSAGVENITENMILEQDLLDTLESISLESNGVAISTEAFEGVKKLYARLNEGLAHGKSLTSVRDASRVKLAFTETQSVYRDRLALWKAFRSTIVAKDIGSVVVSTGRVSEYLAVNGETVSNLDSFFGINADFEKLYFQTYGATLSNLADDLVAIRKKSKYTDGKALEKTVLKPTIALTDSADIVGPKIALDELPSAYILEIRPLSGARSENDPIIAKMVFRDHIYLKLAPKAVGVVKLDVTVADIDKLFDTVKTSLKLVDDALKALGKNSSRVEYLMRGTVVPRETLIELDDTELNQYYVSVWAQTRMISEQVHTCFALARRALEINTALMHIPTAFMREVKYSTESAE